MKYGEGFKPGDRVQCRDGLELVKEPTPCEVWYIAHPVTGDPVANCFNAIAWLRWFAEHDNSRVYVAPWIPEVLAYAGVPTKSEEPGGYDWALAGDEQVIAKLDGLVAVGGHVSKGMKREMDFARKSQKYVTDMSQYRSPRDLPEGFFIEEAVY